MKAKHVVEDAANVWERGRLPHGLEGCRIVISLLDRVIRMKENQKKKFCYVSCLMYPAASMMTKKNVRGSQSARYKIIIKKKVFESSERPKDDIPDN